MRFTFILCGELLKISLRKVERLKLRKNVMAVCDCFCGSVRLFMVVCVCLLQCTLVYSSVYLFSAPCACFYGSVSLFFDRNNHFVAASKTSPRVFPLSHIFSPCETVFSCIDHKTICQRRPTKSEGLFNKFPTTTQRWRHYHHHYHRNREKCSWILNPQKNGERKLPRCVTGSSEIGASEAACTRVRVILPCF